MGSSDSLGPPTDSSAEGDNIYIVSFLTEDAVITIVNGENTSSFNAPAGMQKTSIAFAEGTVEMTVERSGSTIISKTGPAIDFSPVDWSGNTVCL